jgi:hypothetical protein
VGAEERIIIGHTVQGEEVAISYPALEVDLLPLIWRIRIPTLQRKCGHQIHRLQDLIQVHDSRRFLAVLLLQNENVDESEAFTGSLEFTDLPISKSNGIV